MLARNYKIDDNYSSYDDWVFHSYNNFIKYYKTLDIKQQRFYFVYYTNNRKFYLDIDIKTPKSFNYYNLHQLELKLINLFTNFKNNTISIKLNEQWKTNFYIFWSYRKKKFSIHI